jgi:hypothetical protein
MVFRDVELRIYEIFASISDKTATVFTLKLNVSAFQSKTTRYNPTTGSTLATNTP